MAFEVYGMLTGKVSPMMGENVKAACGGEEEAFFRKVVTAIYDEAARRQRGKPKHSQWRNYDDLNQYFRSVDCFLLGWPIRADAEFFCQLFEQLKFETLLDNKPPDMDPRLGKSYLSRYDRMGICLEASIECGVSLYCACRSY